MPLELKEESRREACAASLSDPYSFATTLVVILHDAFGPEFYAWHPGTILFEVRDEFRVELPRPNFDRLMAGVALVASDRFYRNLPDFIQLCNVLSGDIFDPATLDLADTLECAWGITEALLLAPPEEEDEAPFSGEILAYIGRVLDEEGIVNAPDILKLGTRSGDLAGKIHATFADDPELFSAIYQKEDEKTQDINKRIRGNLLLLTTQLSKLRLRNGNAAGLAARLMQNL